MSRHFASAEERNAFLDQPRLAMLLYNGTRPSPTGVPVWFDWDGARVHMFAGRTSQKVAQLSRDPNVSVLVTNHVGEPEGWVAFDGAVEITDFERRGWEALIDRVAPRYWDLNIAGYAQEIARWRATPEAFVALTLTPTSIRSGA